MMALALAGPLARSAVSASGLMLTGSAASWMLPNCNAHIGSTILTPYYSSVQGQAEVHAHPGQQCSTV